MDLMSLLGREDGRELSLCLESSLPMSVLKLFCVESYFMNSATLSLRIRLTELSVIRIIKLLLFY